MSSKVIVNIPPDPFQQQRSKKHQDIVNVDRPGLLALTSSDPVVRANQLEQNIRFLQEQHQIMLAGLHSEIETLRQRNRDLQFQIVFSKGVTLVQNSPSSDEESHRKITLSPNPVNITPLQVEILERNIAELRTNLSEARTRNVYLQNVIDEQKKKMSTLENEKLDLAAVGKKIGKENVSKSKAATQENSLEDLQEKLEDADRLIRRLRRENEEQRKEQMWLSMSVRWKKVFIITISMAQKKSSRETLSASWGLIVSLRSSMNKNKVENRRSEGNNSHRSYYRNGQSQGSRFPPLHGHPHWKNSLDNQGSQASDQRPNRTNKDPEVVGKTVPSLPYLRDRNPASTSTGYSNPAYNNYQSMNYKRGFYYHRKQDDHRSNGRPSRRDQTHQPDSDR